MTGEIIVLPEYTGQQPAAEPPPPDWDLERRLVAGMVVAGLLVFGMGGWATVAKLSGAVIAPGVVVVDSNVKKVQHPYGGVVGQILVRNGDRVPTGHLLMRLDDTQTRAALGVLVVQLTELTGRKSRLAAERDEAEAITFPPGFAAMGLDAERVAVGEQQLFSAKRQIAHGQKARFRQRIGQLRQEIEGMLAQRAAKARELKLVREELARLRDMYKQNLTPITRVLAMERDETRIDGEHGALIAQIARTEGQIAETELRILAIDQLRQTEAQKELREVEGRLAELAERKIAAEDQLKRIELRAPIAGAIHELAVHTVGGVISAGDQVMLIVPNDDLLTIEVRIAPSDIDQVALGQRSILRFPAFNQSTTPEVAGTVSRVAADLTREVPSGQSFYLARIKIDHDSSSNASGLKLVPGMPVESFIETGERTVLSYLVKPLVDQLARAFREE